MRKAIRIQPLGTSRDFSTGFVIQFVHPDPVLAQRVTQELVGSLMEEANREGAIRKTPMTLLLTHPASRPDHARRLGSWIPPSVGLVAGLLLGLLLLMLRYSPQSA